MQFACVSLLRENRWRLFSFASLLVLFLLLSATFVDFLWLKSKQERESSSILSAQIASNPSQAKEWLVFGQTARFLSEDEEEFEGEESFEGRTNEINKQKNSSSKREQKSFKLSRVRRLSWASEKKPILNEFSFPANLVQGMRFVLMCQVLEGEPPMQIKWLKDGRELGSSGSELEEAALANQQQNSFASPELSFDSQPPELMANGGDQLSASLLFRRVHQKHSGNYTCLATNHFGSSSFSSLMSVKVPPKWKLEPQDEESILGQQLTIDCQASGNPAPFIRWKFGQQLSGISQHQQQQTQMPELTGSGNFKLINSNHHVQTLENGSLTIRQTSKEHEGIYLCEADNGVEPALVKALRLLVHVGATFGPNDVQVIQPREAATSTEPSSSPLESNKLTSQSVKWARVMQNASQLRLMCQPHGDAPLTLDWLKDGQLIHSSTHLSSSSQTPSVTQSGGSGNSISSASSQTDSSSQQLQAPAELLVHRGPASANYLVSTRRRQPNNIGGGVNMNGLASLESELVLATPTLRSSDAGLFVCLARNAHGSSERRLRLLVQEPPEPPEVVDVAHIGSRSIGLRWQPPTFDGHSPIIKYIVEYRKQLPDERADDNSNSQLWLATSSSSQWSEKMILANNGQINSPLATPTTTSTASSPNQQLQHTLHDLEPLTRYLIRVLSVNSVDNSRPSVVLSLRTEEEVPSVVPHLVETLVLSSSSIKLHWTISYSPERELIEGFFVGYRSFNVANSGNIGPLPVTSVGSLPSDQHNLGKHFTTPTPAEQPTFTYKTIRLTNQQPNVSSQHDSSAAAASAVLWPISSVTKTLPSASASVALGTPTSSSNPHLSTQQQHQQQQQQMIQLQVSSFEHVIAGLERNTEYTILIQCFNRKGAGPTSDPVIFKTFLNDPPEKLALVADEISESSVRVSWRPMERHQSLLMLPQLSSFKNRNSASNSELLDGFVLTFAKLGPAGKRLRFKEENELNRSHHHQPAAARVSHYPTGGQQQQQQHQQQQQQSNVVVAPINGVEQWQAIQLAPQQRTHQLKNLECGNSYAMKIWAFNKIGKGEPSDLLIVSTRGKTPVAPDRRSFMSVNSTQVRLHLSAWYDGGCEIDKFIVQYRARGQSEWILLSNNILKEQASVLIRDLIPATAYELLISAQNQVGVSEVKYRFVTLDASGNQVSLGQLQQQSPFLPSLESQDEAAFSGDYPNSEGEGGGGSGLSQREFWPNNLTDSSSVVGMKFLLLVRHLLSSPMVLIVSLCLFVTLIMLLMFYRFNGQLSSGSSGASLANKSSSGGSSGGGPSGGCNNQHHPSAHLLQTPLDRRRSSFNGGGSSGDGNTTIFERDLAPMSLLNGDSSGGESPRNLNNNNLTLPSGGAASNRLRSLNSGYANNQQTSESECGYQAFYGPQQQQQQQQHHHHQQQEANVDYGQTQNSDPFQSAGAYNMQQSTVYGQVPSGYRAFSNAVTRPLMGNSNYATVQRPLEGTPISSSAGVEEQRCLMQMLMMNQQHNQLESELDSHNSYVVAALNTLARNNNNKQSVEHCTSTAGDQQQQQQQNLNNLNSTVGRQQHQLSADYQQRCQNSTNFGPDQTNQFQSNQFPAATTTLTKQNKAKPTTNSTRTQRKPDELYPLSTFRRPPAQLQAATTSEYCSSNSTASTSGRGTSYSGGANNSIVTPNESQLKQLNSILPKLITVDDYTLAGQSDELTKGNELQTNGKVCDTESFNNDKPQSPYDVPFKFLQLTADSSSEAVNKKKKQESSSPSVAEGICY